MVFNIPARIKRFSEAGSGDYWTSQQMDVQLLKTAIWATTRQHFCGPDEQQQISDVHDSLTDDRQPETLVDY